MVSTLILTAVKVLISGGLIALVLWGVDISGVYSQIMTSSTLNFVFALAFMMGLALIHSERWRFVLRQLRIKLTFQTAIKLVLISYFFNQTLPSTVGGDAFRIWGVYRTGISFKDAVSSVIVDRVVALISLLIMIVASSPWLLDLFRSPSAPWALSFLVAAGAMGFALLLLSDRLDDWLSRWRVGQILVSIVVCARAVLLDVKVAISVVALTICSYVVVSLAVYLLARGMLIDLEFKNTLLLMPLIILVTIFPVSIAGWGIREGAMVMALGLIGVSSVEALSLSILFGLVLLVSGLPGGLIWLVEHYGRNNESDDDLVLPRKNKS